MGGSDDRMDGVSFVLLRLFDIASCCMIIEVMAIRFGHGFKDQRGYTFEYIVSGCGGCHGRLPHICDSLSIIVSISTI